MLAEIMQTIQAFWQQPQTIHINDALPWLFLVVMLGIVFLPLPIETLMFASLTLAKHWHYPLLLLFIIFIIGTWVGLQLSYMAGSWLEHLVEPWLLRRLKITPEQWRQKQKQFRRFDIIILLFGLFIPGFRHLVGILAGGSQMHYPLFASLALVGATIWVSTFTLLGWLVG